MPIFTNTYHDTCQIHTNTGLVQHTGFTTAAKAAEAGVPRAKACGGPDQDMATARSAPRIGAAGSTAGKEGAGVAAAPGAVAAAGAAADWPPPPEAGQASTPKQASA